MSLSTDSGSTAPAQRPQDSSRRGLRIAEKQFPERINFGIQRKIVAHMTTKSWQNVPHASYSYEPDITDFFAQFKILRASDSEKEKLTFNTLILRALVEGLKAAPLLNSHIAYNDKSVRGSVTPQRHIDISMPWILPGDEMMTVKLRHFENKSLAEMTAYMGDTRRKIENTDLNQAMYEVAFQDTIQLLQQGKLLTCLRKLVGSKTGKERLQVLSPAQKKIYHQIPPKDRLTTEDLTPGSVTISNIGSVYLQQRGLMSLLEVIPPQVFAIGVGAAQEKPGVFGSESNRRIGIRTTLPFCLSFDHRALDFAALVPFLKKMDEIFEYPQIMQEW